MLAVQMNCILKQKDLKTLEYKNKILYVGVGVGILLSFAVLPYFNVRGYKSYHSTDFDLIAIDQNYFEEREKLWRKIESQYGYLSGAEYLVLTMLFAIVFYNLNKILTNSSFLNL